MTRKNPGGNLPVIHKLAKWHKIHGSALNASISRFYSI